MVAASERVNEHEAVITLTRFLSFLMDFCKPSMIFSRDSNLSSVKSSSLYLLLIPCSTDLRTLRSSSFANLLFAHIPPEQPGSTCARKIHKYC